MESKEVKWQVRKDEGEKWLKPMSESILGRHVCRMTWTQHTLFFPYLYSMSVDSPWKHVRIISFLLFVVFPPSSSPDSSVILFRLQLSRSREGNVSVSVIDVTSKGDFRWVFFPASLFFRMSKSDLSLRFSPFSFTSSWSIKWLGLWYCMTHLDLMYHNKKKHGMKRMDERCEVSAEAPSFQTARESKMMRVFGKFTLLIWFCWLSPQLMIILPLKNNRRHNAELRLTHFRVILWLQNNREKVTSVPLSLSCFLFTRNAIYPQDLLSADPTSEVLSPTHSLFLSIGHPFRGSYFPSVS